MEREAEAKDNLWRARLDAVLMHRIWGSLIFLGIVYIIFFLSFAIGDPLVRLIQTGTQLFSVWASRMLEPWPRLQSLLGEGEVGGVGGVLALIAAVSLLGYLPLPLYGVSRILFHVLLILMAAGSIAVAVSSKKSAARLKVQAADEEKETEDILQWFLKTYSARGLDDQLLMEDPELSGEELELKRFELIQDYLVTGRDLPDQSYADALCDMIYERLYGKA